MPNVYHCDFWFLYCMFRGEVWLSVHLCLRTKVYTWINSERLVEDHQDFEKKHTHIQQPWETQTSQELPWFYGQTSVPGLQLPSCGWLQCHPVWRCYTPWWTVRGSSPTTMVYGDTFLLEVYHVKQNYNRFTNAPPSTKKMWIQTKPQIVGAFFSGIPQ